MTLTDTHLHIADAKFDLDRDEVLERAHAAGVTTLIEIAESPESWETAVALAENHPFIYASLGIHPHHAHEAGPDRWPALARRLREFLKRPKVVAIGEFGLDYFRMQNSRKEQDYLFRQQLDLAQEFGKPVVIHCREADRPAPGAGPALTGAHADVQKALIQYSPGPLYARQCPKPKGVIHCFSGTWEDAQTYLAHGYLLGFDGPVTYPKNDPLKEIAVRLPLERMVLETDSPYLPPQTHRGQRNEPSYLAAVASEIATLRHKTLEEVARQTTENATALFRLA